LKNKEEIIKNQKEYALTCSWENRAIQWKNVIYKLVFYATKHFPSELLSEYICSLNTKYNIIYTTNLEEIEINDLDEIVFVHELFDPRIFEKYKNVSYLNTEPLNISYRLNYVKYNVNDRYPQIKYFYDYSLSNINIMNKCGIYKTKFLPYLYNKKEVDLLKKIKNEVEQVYDFGIICSSSLSTTEVEHLTPQRRKNIVKHLIENGFSVNIIKGFDEKRDREIAKCRQLLNIHGQLFEEQTMIFEHLRCNRLLYAGYNILSETSHDMDNNFINKYPNLTFKDYDDFFKMKKLNIFV